MRRRRTRAKHAAPAAARADGVQLAWARDRHGAKVRAARLDPADRRARAPFTCLGCGDALVPHLGARRARHFAHRPGSTCALTAPETALHLDAKERLLELCAEAFSGARAVTLVTRCAACRRAVPRELRALGDGAAAEGAVGALRADVLVTRGGRPALALEVKVTHALEPAKEAALAAAGLPAVEIDARAGWEREGAGGAAEVACARSLGFPPCSACAAEARAAAERARGGEAAEIAELESYRARGLLGPPPGAPAPEEPAPPLAAAERRAIASRFRCPTCGASGPAALIAGERLVRHPCPGAPPRPVAWRGYDGAIVELAWWRAAR
jgi:hypothetical protein